MNSSNQMPIGPSLDHVKFLDTLINSIPNIVYIYNIVDQTNVYSNDGILKVLGYSAEDLQKMGQRMLQILMHPDDFAAYQSKTKPAYALLGDNEFLIKQFRMKHRNGSWHWLESNETIYERTSDKTPYKIFGVIHDITKNKTAEATLLQSNALLTQAQQLTHSGHYVLDIATGLWTSSKTIDAVLGIDGSYHRSIEGWLELVHPDWREEMKVYFINYVLKERQPFNKEYKILRQSDRTARWVVGLGDLVFGSDGKPTEMFGTIQDITERKLMEEEQKIALSQAQKKEIENISFLNAAKAVLESDSFEKTARLVFDHCRIATGASSGYVALMSLSGDENEVLFLESGGLPCNVNPNLPMPIRGLRAQAYSKGSAVYENDFMRSNWVGLMPEGHVQLQNVMFAPLKIGNKVVGVIGLANKLTDFTEGDAKLAGTFGDLAAIALNRTRAEEKLKESEQKYRNLVDSANEVILVTQDDKIKFANHKAVELSGYSEQDILLRSFLDFVYPDDRQMIISNNSRRMKGEIVQSRYNFRLRSADATTIWVETNSVLIDWNGKPATLNLLTDITDRKQAEDAKREGELKLDLAVRSANMGVWQWNILTDTRSFDNQACSLLGIFPETFKGTAAEFFNSVHPDDREKLKAVLNQVVSKNEMYKPEYRVVWKDGSIHHISARGRLSRDEEGRPLRIDGVIWDVTERKRAEEEHLAYEQQLQLSQKLESLGILAGGIAHDFNNLMGGIFGYIDLASEESKDEKVIRYLSKAMNTIDRARGLTAQLLTFAKGGAPLQKIGPLFPFIQETAQFALSGASVSCHFKVSKNLWMCNFDSNQMGQVIDNLIINAKQAMPSGGTIEVSAENVTLGEKCPVTLIAGNYIKISIKDNGIGMPKEILPRIFDPFFTTKTTGHGLGLATCHSIISRHRGCINVESESGKGTTFNIY